MVSVLVVDDEEGFRRAIKWRLARRGIVADQGANGEECMSILDKKPVDVVVMYFKMPRMNGKVEVNGRLKKNLPWLK